MLSSTTRNTSTYGKFTLWDVFQKNPAKLYLFAGTETDVGVTILSARGFSLHDHTLPILNEITACALRATGLQASQADSTSPAQASQERQALAG